MKFANSSFRAARGFTLIEIMVVVVILGILAALIAPNVISRIDDAQGAKVKQDIRAIESALKLYRLDRFRYPTGQEGLDALVTPPQDTVPEVARRRLPGPDAQGSLGPPVCLREPRQAG